MQQSAETHCEKPSLTAREGHLSVHSAQAASQMRADEEHECTAPAVRHISAPRPQTACYYDMTMCFCRWSATVPAGNVDLRPPTRCSARGRRWTPVSTAKHCGLSAQFTVTKPAVTKNINLRKATGLTQWPKSPKPYLGYWLMAPRSWY